MTAINEIKNSTNCTINSKFVSDSKVLLYRQTSYLEAKKMITMRKYHSGNAKAKTWDHIENMYIEIWQGKHERLVELVRHIKNSDYKVRLFGSTSMDKLVVSIYDPIDYYKEALHITFDLWNKKWHFEYFALPFQDPEFVRTYEEEKGIEKFDGFIKMIKW